MSRETETYRLELEQIRAAFTGKAVINRTELMAYLGKKRSWLDSHGFAGKDFYSCICSKQIIKNEMKQGGKMYAKIEMITPDMASQFLKKNDNNRKLNMGVVKKYAEDIKNGNWRLNGETIVISRHGTLKNGQHRLNAIVLANTPAQMLVVYDVEDSINYYDRGWSRSTSNILQMNGYPRSVCDPAIAGALRLLIMESGFKSPSDAQIIKTVDYFQTTHSLSIAYDSISYGANHPICKKAGCAAAAIVASHYGIDDRMLKSFFAVVNTGFSESAEQYAGIVVRNFILQKKGNGHVFIRETFLQTLNGIFDYSNGVPRKNVYRINKELPMMTEVKQSIKDLLK